MPKTPPNGVGLTSIASVTSIPLSPLPASDAASGEVSHTASEHTKTTGSLSNDGGEAEDRIKAPVGREILTANQRVRPESVPVTGIVSEIFL